MQTNGKLGEILAFFLRFRVNLRQNKEYLQNFTNKFVYFKKICYLCSRFGCKGITHACVRASGRIKK